MSTCSARGVGAGVSTSPHYFNLYTGSRNVQAPPSCAVSTRRTVSETRRDRGGCGGKGSVGGVGGAGGVGGTGAGAGDGSSGGGGVALPPSARTAAQVQQQRLEQMRNSLDTMRAMRAR